MDREIVSRNNPRGKYHRVALSEADIGMIIVRDAGECGPRFALTARAEIEHPARRQLRRLDFIDEGREPLEITCFARRIGDLVHGAADEGDLPAMRLGGV